MNKLKLFLFTICLFSSFVSRCDDKQERMEKLIEEIKYIFNSIDTDSIVEKLIVDEKIRLIEALLGKDEGSSTENDKEAHFFIPKKPEPLTEEEKNLSVQERVAKKYIGDLPTQVNDLIFYFSNHEECLEKKKAIYNRLLLHGNPGTGKTHLFKVLAQELQVQSLSFSASFFADKYIGETSRRVRKAFDAAKNVNEPILVFIDEIDALATKRQANTHDEHRSTLITLLTELQNLQENKNIFVIAATNDMKALDPAIKDRFAGSICEIKNLTSKQRAELFKKVFLDKNFPIDDNLAQRLAAVTYSSSISEQEGKFSNRDVEYIVTTALLKQFADSKNNKGSEKHICAYIREAIDATGKNANYAKIYSSYCNGI